jgi:hypothetical protein
VKLFDECELLGDEVFNFVWRSVWVTRQRVALMKSSLDQRGEMLNRGNMLRAYFLWIVVL